MITDLKISLDCEPLRRSIEAQGPTLSIAISQACGELSRMYSRLPNPKTVVGVRRIEDELDEDSTAPFATIELRCDPRLLSSPFTLANGIDFMREAATVDDILVMIDVTDVYQRASARVAGVNFPDTLDKSYRDVDLDPECCLENFVAAAHGMMLWDCDLPPIDIRQELDRLWGSAGWQEGLALQQLHIPEVKVRDINVVGQCANGWMIRFDYTEGEKAGREVEFVWRNPAGRYQVCRDERSALRAYGAAFLGGQIDQVHDALQSALDAGKYLVKPRVWLTSVESRSDTEVVAA